MRLSSRDKKALMLGGLALAALIGFRYVLMPLNDSWRDARQRIAQAGDTLQRLQDQQLQLRAQQRRLMDFYGQGLAQPLPTAEQAGVEFVKTVEDLLKAAGLGSQGVQAQPVRPLREVPGVAVVGLQVQLAGRPEQITQCLASLCQSQQPILVQSLTATRPGKDGDQQLNVSMVIATLARWEGGR